MCNWQGKAITKAKGHEPMLYEALYVIVGPFFIFTNSVELKGPNKQLNPKNCNISRILCFTIHIRHLCFNI